jgi:hypothetical protein
MSTNQPPVGDMLITVKSSEVQRGMLAEMARNPTGAAPHFLAAAHLELVLANDYEQAGQGDLAFRSRVSAASCFWRAGQREQAQNLFNSLLKTRPDKAPSIQEALADLEREYP